MKIPFYPEPDVLHHAHGVDLHKNRFQDSVSLNGFEELPVGIADLLFLLIDIHPGFSIRTCPNIEDSIHPVIFFILLKNPETEDQKKCEGQRKERSNNPMGLYSGMAYHLF